MGHYISTAVATATVCYVPCLTLGMELLTSAITKATINKNYFKFKNNEMYCLSPTYN